VVTIAIVVVFVQGLNFHKLEFFFHCIVYTCFDFCCKVWGFTSWGLSPLHNFYMLWYLLQLLWFLLQGLNFHKLRFFSITQLLLVMVSIWVVVVFVARFKFSQLEVFSITPLLLKHTWRSWKNKEIFRNLTSTIICWQELAKKFTFWLLEACGLGKCMWTNELKAKFVNGVECEEFIEMSDLN
jgi:hypothetical protein